jgi:hypothetical protein
MSVDDIYSDAFDDIIKFIEDSLKN